MQMVFSPDIRINEFNWNLVSFGETNEPLLAEAIYEITGRSSLKSVRSASKPVPLIFLILPNRVLEIIWYYISSDNYLFLFFSPL